MSTGPAAPSNLDELRHRAEEAEGPAAQARAWIGLAEAQRNQDAAGMLPTSERAVAAAETADDPDLLALALIVRTDALRLSGAMKEALAAAEQAVALARAHELRQREGAALLRLGFVLDALSDFDAATVALRAATTVMEALGNQAGVASAFNSLGIVRSRAGDTEAGITYYTRARQIHEQLGESPVQVIQVLNNLVINLKNLERYDEALRFNDEALALAKRVDQNYPLTAVLSNRGVLLSAMGRADEAGAVFEQALSQARAYGYPYFLTETLRRYGQLLLQQGRAAEAGPLLSEAVDLAHGMSAREQLLQALLARSDWAETQGDLPAALADLKRARAVEAELSDERLRTRLDALEGQRERELAHRTSDEERRRHEELRRAHAELEDLHTRLAEQANLLEARSRTDHLTGLANRRHFDERWRDEARRCQRYGHHLALAMVDLDRFKQVNDRFTHVIGDQVLRAVAGLMRDQTRDTDMVARYGGEEFVVLFPDTELEDAAAACRKLMQAVSQHPWMVLHPGLDTLSVSIGLASSSEGLQHDELVLVADRRLYGAKEGGRALLVAADL